MKCCSSNCGAAYSPPVLGWVASARKAAWRNRRGSLMGRRDSLHRFAVILCASLFLAMAPRGSAVPNSQAHPEALAAQASPQQSDSSQSSTSQSKTPEQARTEQYTLSHERQAKAVAYSRAGYTLYFV